LLVSFLPSFGLCFFLSLFLSFFSLSIILVFYLLSISSLSLFSLSFPYFSFSFPVFSRSPLFRSVSLFLPFLFVSFVLPSSLSLSPFFVSVFKFSFSPFFLFLSAHRF
jgi:hypothetical protein